MSSRVSNNSNVSRRRNSNSSVDRGRDTSVNRHAPDSSKLPSYNYFRDQKNDGGYIADSYYDQNAKHFTNLDNIDDWLADQADLASVGDKDERDRGRAYSQKEIWEKQYDRMVTQDEREYQQDFYDRNYSYTGQVSQMQNAGLNPALLYGETSSTASSGSSGSTTSSPANASQEQFDSPMTKLNSFVSMLGSLFGVGSQIGSLVNQSKQTASNIDVAQENKKAIAAQTRKTNAEAEKLEFDNSGNQERWDLEVTSRHLDNALKLSQIDLTDKQIEVANATIDKLHSEKSLNELQYSQESRLFYTRLMTAWQDLNNKKQEGSNLKLTADNLKATCAKLGEEIKASKRANDYAELAKSYGLSDNEEDIAVAVVLSEYGKHVTKLQFAKTLAGVRALRLRGDDFNHQTNSMWTYLSSLLGSTTSSDEEIIDDTP